MSDNLTVDPVLDLSLRPTTWDGFIGNRGVSRALKIFQDAAHRRGHQLGHILLDGMSGCGKTTMAGILAASAGRKLHVVNCANIEDMEDFLTSILNLEAGDYILADEAHAMPARLQEGLYHLIEDGVYTGMFRGKRCAVPFPPFTLIACTTRSGALTKPFLNRFEIAQTVEFYKPEELALILADSCRKLHVAATEDALLAIARRSRGTPRIANILLKRCRDFADVEGNGNGVIELSEIIGCMTMLGIDDDGLDALDRRILAVLARSTRPIGIKALASGLQVDLKTVEELREPWLFHCGYIGRLANGRVVTDSGRAKVP